MSGNYSVGGFTDSGKEISGGEFSDHDDALEAMRHFETNVPSAASMSIWHYDEDGTVEELEGFAR